MKFEARLMAALAAACLSAACAIVKEPGPAAANPAASERQHEPGARWYKLATEPYKGKQDDIFFVDAKLGFYVNGKGKVFRSDDGGASWTLQFAQPGTYFRAIGML